MMASMHAASCGRWVMWREALNAPKNNTTRHNTWYLGRFLANFARANALQEASADAEHVRGVREPFWTRATQSLVAA